LIAPFSAPLIAFADSYIIDTLLIRHY
jgi:hypothetical protein